MLLLSSHVVRHMGNYLKCLLYKGTNKNNFFSFKIFQSLFRKYFDMIIFVLKEVTVVIPILKLLLELILKSLIS